jgi:hypothetical protein
VDQAAAREVVEAEPLAVPVLVPLAARAPAALAEALAAEVPAVSAGEVPAVGHSASGADRAVQVGGVNGLADHAVAVRARGNITSLAGRSVENGRWLDQRPFSTRFRLIARFNSLRATDSSSP